MVTLENFANELWLARSKLRPIPRLTLRKRSLNVIEAYHIQKLNVNRKLTDGHSIVGRKIGLTSKAVQQQFGVNEPDYGYLFDSMQCEEGEVIALERLMQPKMEAEIAFSLKKGLTRDLSPEALVDTIDYACIAVEIVDSAIADWDLTIADTIADNASTGLFCLGSEKVALENIDLKNCAMKVVSKGETLSSGVGAATMGSPLVSLQWLAAKCIEMGDPLRRGEVVLTGALGPMVTVHAGGSFQVSIESLGNLEVTFGERNRLGVKTDATG